MIASGNGASTGLRRELVGSLLQRRQATKGTMKQGITSTDFQKGGRWLRSISGP